MNFWKSFSKKAALRQFCFGLVIIALLIPVAIWDSGTQVKVSFGSSQVQIKSDRYNMTVPYELIADAQLQPLGDPGEKVEEGFDNDIIRTGTWKNDAWGVYSVNADPDTSTCVVMQLTDGRIFVFSIKNDEKTAETYETLLTYIS